MNLITAFLKLNLELKYYDYLHVHDVIITLIRKCCYSEFFLTLITLTILCQFYIYTIYRPTTLKKKIKIKNSDFCRLLERTNGTNKKNS